MKTNACLRKSITNNTRWNTETEYQHKKIKLLLKDLRNLIDFIENEFDFQTFN